MRLGYIGNFTAPWCTEVHVKRAWELEGHDVIEYQENDPQAWKALEREAPLLDFVLWTRTWELDSAITTAPLAAVKANAALVGYHLDRWWGLAREREVMRHPFFRECDLVCTADGGHYEQWVRAGVEHAWYPPAVLGEEAVLDPPLPAEHARWPEVLFVGSHRGYHPEWAYRLQLVKWLRKRYGERVTFYPLPHDYFAYEWRGNVVRSGQVRGPLLNEVYQRARVVVGDSCLANGATRYWSDRVPETIGRGGVLIHPRVEGMQLVDGEHFLGYTLGDFDELESQIERALSDDEEREHIREAGRAQVLARDTYECRVRALALELDRRELV